jgi:acyl carrier protein
MTNIASRTPEGQPNTCPVCGGVVCIEPSVALSECRYSDAPCPNCGTLLWFVRSDGESRIYSTNTIQSLASRIMAALGRLVGARAEDIASETLFLEDLGTDSLDTAELIMQLQEDGIVISDDQAEQMETVQDAIRFIESRRRMSP